MSVNIDLFAAHIESMMGEYTKNVFGYSYFILKEDKGKKPKPGFDPSGSWISRGGAKGIALMPGVNSLRPGGMLLNQNHRLELSSVSKTITATAVLKEIARLSQIDPSISLDTKIQDFLPAEWLPDLSANAKLLTFRHLLEQTSGLEEVGSINVPQDQPALASRDTSVAFPGSLYASMRTSLKIGPPKAPPSPFVYKNVNFSLFRIILPYMIYYKKPGTTMDECLATSRITAKNIDEHVEDGDAPIAFKYFLGSTYVTYIQSKIFAPLGFANADISVYEPKVRYYSVNHSTYPGTEGRADSILLCGGTEWKLSAKELCLFALSLTRGLLYAGIWNIMKDPSSLIGLTRPPEKGIFGKYMGKSGSYLDDLNVTGSGSGWMVVPPFNGGSMIVAALITNCYRDDAEVASPYTILRMAHDAALLGNVGDIFNLV